MKKKLFMLTLIVYAYILLQVIVFKFLSPLELFHSSFYGHTRDISLVPFQEMWQSDVSLNIKRDNLLGNIILFIPVGLFLALVVPWKRAIGYACLLSMSFEIAQYVFGVGFTDIDDVLLNTLGGAIGVGIAYVLGEERTRTVISYVGGIVAIGLIIIEGLLIAVNG